MSGFDFKFAAFTFWKGRDECSGKSRVSEVVLVTVLRVLHKALQWLCMGNVSCKKRMVRQFRGALYMQINWEKWCIISLPVLAQIVDTGHFIKNRSLLSRRFGGQRSWMRHAQSLWPLVRALRETSSQFWEHMQKRSHGELGSQIVGTSQCCSFYNSPLSQALSKVPWEMHWSLLRKMPHNQTIIH